MAFTLTDPRVFGGPLSQVEVSVAGTEVIHLDPVTTCVPRRPPRLGDRWSRDDASFVVPTGRVRLVPTLEPVPGRVLAVDDHGAVGRLPTRLAAELFPGLLTLYLLEPSCLATCTARPAAIRLGTTPRVDLLADLAELRRLTG
ncbi:hypothetical protein FTX61_17310 [Nitriliruptoraceae bacterium ZYF776]|nr:hypothetical protein [Profundirhabdus halotolerans]